MKLEHNWKLSRFLLVCGLCHQQATQQYPHGYAPRLLGREPQYIDPEWREAPCCECTENIRDDTCYPCVDRILDLKLNTASDLDRWPTFNEPDAYGSGVRLLDDRDQLRPVRARPGTDANPWMICPCGREINPVAHPTTYPPEIWIGGREDAVGELDYEAMEMDHAWSLFCLDCNGLWVPNTSGEERPKNYEEQAPRVMFKEALNLGGPKTRPTNWRKQPRVDVDMIVEIARQKRPKRQRGLRQPGLTTRRDHSNPNPIVPIVFP